jgi:hypothetical protein
MPHYEVQIHHHVRITMRDGVALSANLWLPVPRAPGETFPAILEMIPYRKDDWRYNSDLARMTYFAQRGFAGCRLDVRGTGSSGGLARDEYTPEETQDGYEAVEWLAAQPWCNGNVGMWGISYGGFTAIQVAALQPPHLKAIIPMYATDDRYLCDVHYYGGCLTMSDLAQYAVGMVAMNALPPKAEYLGSNFAAEWKRRLEQTPPWLIEWLRQQTDGPYYRSGSLAPHYDRIKCAIFHIGGWQDGYTDPVLRMQERCVNAPRKALIGNWGHLYPDDGYPGPNLDHLHEMARFFEYWLQGVDNGVMAEPPVTVFLREWTPPVPFPAAQNGRWRSYAAYPPADFPLITFYLDSAGLHPKSAIKNQESEIQHRPTWGATGPFSSGGGSPPNGLARDQRPDEALALTFTSEPLAGPLDVLGIPELTVHVSCTAPVATLVARLCDVHPGGASALVAQGALNLTHRESHAHPAPLVPGEVYAVDIPLKATGYRFLPGHRVRLTLGSTHFPLLWPSPYPCTLTIHAGPQLRSTLTLPLAPAGELAPPQFKTTPPELMGVGGGSEKAAQWRITEDVIAGSVTVSSYGGDTAELPDGRSLTTNERLAITAFHADPAHAQLINECNYILRERGYETHVHSSGAFRSTATDFHLDIQLTVKLNGKLFFRKSWLETVPRNLV